MINSKIIIEKEVHRLILRIQIEKTKAKSFSLLAFVFLSFIYFFHFNRKLLLTTLTLLSAIAAPAIIGLSMNPLIG